MNSTISVATLRTQIGDLFSTDSFIGLLNQALARITQSGRWKSSQVYCQFASVPLGYVTLPYELLSIMGVSMAGVPVPVFSQYYEYLISGPGHIDETKPAIGILDYINDGFPVRVDVPTNNSTLRIVLDSALDVGRTFRFFGTNTSDQEIFTPSGKGFNVLTTGATTNDTTAINSVTGIEVPTDPSTGLPVMIGGWTLYSVNGATATQLGYYYPNETRPAYARYKVGTWNVANDNDKLTIRALCQRRVIPVYKETDPVFPDNIGALKAAMQAIQNEDANNYKEAEVNWQYVSEVLNNEVHSARGGARPLISIPQSTFGHYSFDGGIWGYSGFGGCG